MNANSNLAVTTGRTPVLRWQSQLVVFVCVVITGSAVSGDLAMAGRSGPLSPGTALTGLAVACCFGLLVWLLRAATSYAALTGALFTASLYYAASGWRTLLWPLMALFVLTFAATRFGRARKEELQVAEQRTGRTAAQVAANLGAAALATIRLSSPHLRFILHLPLMLTDRRMFVIASVAALAEATADTLSSELGEVLGGEPFLLTTLRRVPAGTDGAISLAGTVAGCAGAAIVCLIAAAVLPLSRNEGLAALAAGVFGLFFDSLLGATLERWGWLNNDAVNFLSTCAAALLGALLAATR